MGKPKKKPSSRVNVYIPQEQLAQVRLIENFSAFIQMCIDQAPDIMAFAMLHEIDPKKYHTRKKMDDVVEDFNKRFPLDPLTKRRQEKRWQENSPTLPDVLL